jgi:hypothetical protein
MDKTPTVIIKNIMSYQYISDILHLSSCNKYLNNVRIPRFTVDTRKSLFHIIPLKIFKQLRYRDLEVLDLHLITNLYNDNSKYDNKDINLDTFKKLKVLEISGEHNIFNNDDIKNITWIRKINAYYNNKITNINHISRLEVFNGTHNYKLTNIHLIGLVNLTSLTITDCININDINHLIQLKELNIDGKCGVDDNGIKDLIYIESLSVIDNIKIKNIFHMKLLKKLSTGENNPLTSDDVNKLTGLEYLYLQKSTIFDISKLINLIHLGLSNNSGCYKIDKSTNTSPIIKFGNFTKLKVLYCTNYHSINNEQLSKAVNLERLLLRGNERVITNINKLTNLKYLQFSDLPPKAYKNCKKLVTIINRGKKY